MTTVFRNFFFWSVWKTWDLLERALIAVLYLSIAFALDAFFRGRDIGFLAMAGWAFLVSAPFAALFLWYMIFSRERFYAFLLAKAMKRWGAPSPR